MLLTVGNARYNQRKDSCRSPASGGLLQLFSAASRTGLWSRVHQLVGRARCRSRRQVPAPAFLHPCDVPYHPRHLVTPEAWSGGRKPAHGRRSCRSRDLADPGAAPGRLGSLTPTRRKRRHMARRHIMPYQDAGRQSHQLATWAHNITQGRSPPVKGRTGSPQISSYRKAVEH